MTTNFTAQPLEKGHPVAAWPRRDSAEAKFVAGEQRVCCERVCDEYEYMFHQNL